MTRVAFVSPEPTPYRSPLLDRVAAQDGIDLTVIYAARTVAGRTWKGRYRGQRQKWYAVRFTGRDSEINVASPGGGGHKAEFVSWRWEPMKNLPDLIVPFKRPVYERVVKEFSGLAGS